MTYYRNLPRHLTGAEETKLDVIIARANIQALGIAPRHEHPRVWVEDCDEETARALDKALARMSLINSQEYQQ
jgi:hypothetical protein